MLVDMRKDYEEYRRKDPGLLGQELAFEVLRLCAARVSYAVTGGFTSMGHDTVGTDDLNSIPRLQVMTVGHIY